MAFVRPEDMDMVTSAIKSGIIRQQALRNYTPEAIGKTVEQLRASDKDNSTKLSQAEAEQYLKKISKPSGSGMEGVMLDIYHDKLCENAGAADIESSSSKEKLERIRADAIGELQFLRDVASITKALPKTAKGKKNLQEKEDRIIDSYSEIVSRKLIQTVGEIPGGDATMLTREIVEKTKLILSENPGLLKKIDKMPDFSELGKLDANRVCKALTNKGVGLQA